MIAVLGIRHSQGWRRLLLLLGASFISAYACAQGYLTGPTAVTVGTTQTYVYHTNVYLGYPNWVIHGGSQQSTSQTGTNYYLTVYWSSAGNGGTDYVQIQDYSSVVATLNVDVCTSGQTVGLSLSGPTSICLTHTATYTATPTNGGTSPFYEWFVNNISKQTGSSTSFSSTQLEQSDVVQVTLTSNIMCLTATSISKTKTIATATTPTAVVPTIVSSPIVCPGVQATIVCEVDNGGSGPTYTWYRGVNQANDNTISGNTNMYSPSNPFNNGETVKCKVTSNSTCISGSATVTSSPITMQVVALPASFTALGANNLTTTGLNARWNSSSGSTTYRLDLSYDSLFSLHYVSNYPKDVGLVTSYTVGGLTPGTTYYYQVEAVNCAGTRISSGYIKTRTICNAPSAANATNVQTTQFQANWAASTGADSYRIDVSPNSAFSGTLVLDNVVLPKTPLYKVVNSGLTAGGTYWYRVRAYHAWGTSTNSNPISVTLFCSPPVVASPSNITTTTFNANWQTSVNATSYLLDVATSINFTGATTYSVSGGSSTTKQVTGLSPGGVYYYQVRAVNGAGNSAVSGPQTVVTTPVANAATNVNSTNFTASWASGPGADGYRLDVSTDPSFTGGFVGVYNNYSLTSNSIVVTGLSPNTHYYFQVRAAKGSVYSPSSTAIQVITAPAAPIVYPASNITPTTFSANWSQVSGATSYLLDVATSNTFTGATTYTVNGGSTTTKQVTGLSPGGVYYYQVRAVNGSGNSGVSGTQTVVTTPVANAATNVNSASFTVSWSLGPGADGYRLDVSTDPSFNVGFVGVYNNYALTATSITITGLSPATQYYFQVRSAKGSVYSPSSASIQVITTTAAPVVNQASGVSPTTFSANWSQVAGATSYLLDVAASSNFTGATTYTVSGGSTTTKQLSGFSPGGAYYYRLRAVNGGGNSGFSGTQTVVTTPIASAATNVKSNQFTVSWSSGPGADGYRLDVSTDPSFNGGLVGVYNNYSITSTSITIIGLSAATQYYFQVRAAKGAVYSPSSAPIAIITTTMAPVAIDATDIAPTSFQANWHQVSGATGYEMDYTKDPAFNSFNTLSTANLSLNVSGLDYSAGYYYRVRALNAGGHSDNSNVVTVGSASYVWTIEPSVELITTVAAAQAAPKEQRLTTVAYFDGLGRPLQTVTREGSPLGFDIVQPFAYDAFGREAQKYLPFVATQNSGSLKPDVINSTNGGYQGLASSFYNDGSDLIADDNQPFSQTLFEASPLDRPLKQGASGEAWQPNTSPYSTPTDRTIAITYISNSSSEVLMWTYSQPTGFPLGMIDAGTSSAPVYYPANELTKTGTKDEEHHEVIEYKDKLGRVVLKKVQGPSNTWALTYYVYDDFNRLVAVVPPEASNRLSAEFYQAGATNTTKDIFLKRWAFRYVFDGRGRMIMKQVPGADPVYMVYDGRDRLVLTQDGDQRNASQKEWTFTKYDQLNRPVLTGKYLSSKSLTSMQTSVDSSFNLAGTQTKYEVYINSGNGNVLGYTNNSYPPIVDASSYYTVTYYDSYDMFIAPTGYGYMDESLPGEPTANFPRTVGQVTGTQVKNLTTGAWMRTVSYYDDHYRVIQTTADHQKGTIRTTNTYDFVGKLLISKRTYVVNGTTATVKETYTYDHAGRLLTVQHSTNGAADVMISKNVYNEIGQLVDKSLHSSDNGSSFRQSVDYRYNIRGWMTKINQADVSTIAQGDRTYDYFGMELAYNNTLSGLNSTPAYNGNISAMEWSKGDSGTVAQQAYAFTYDPMNRLSNAGHYDYEGAAWSGNNNAYQEAMSYDLNGNIQSLTRKGYMGEAIDNLTYNYTGNQLNYVNDSDDPVKGFINGNTGTDDYSYDHNGNLNKDKNKGITNAGNIGYNYLNLPKSVVKGGDSIRYIYDATGKKLAQELYQGGTLTKTTDYIGEMVYENNVLQFINDEEGRVLPDGAGWEYQYNLKDHLGNVRVTFTAKAQTATRYATDFEASSNPNFDNYSNTTFDLVDHTDAGAAYQKVQWLNGGVNGQVGLGKSFAVMPGDLITASAYVKYMNLSANNNPNVLITSLAAAFGVGPESTGEAGKIYSGLSDYAGTVPLGDHPADDEGAPKAFVTILFFDKDYNFLDAAWDQVSTIGAQTSPTTKQPPHDFITVTAEAKQGGYAYVFLSNENPTYVDVYFDDATFSFTPSPIVQVDDYYPFGLTYNGYTRENATPNQYQYNGKELQDELDLGWLDYGARMYEPTIGRWMILDPFSNKMRRHSPYDYAFDNPLKFLDPDGMEPKTDFIDENGKKHHIDDGSNAVFEIKKTDGLDQRKHYEFKCFDRSQGGKNEVVMKTLIQEQNQYNQDNEALKQADDGRTFCNYAVQNNQEAIKSVTGEDIVTNGNANQMAEELCNNPNYLNVNHDIAENVAENGHLAVASFENFAVNKDGNRKSGHEATFSVGDNVKKGQLSNIGQSNGFKSVGGAFGSYKSSVEYFVLKSDYDSVCK